MEIKEGRLFLGKVRHIESAIRRKESQIEALYAALLPRGIRYDGTKVQGGAKDMIGEIEAKIDELERDIHKLLIQKRMALLDISDAIEDLQGDNEREALMKFYISEKRVRDIAEEMNYSERAIYQIMRRGIERL